MKKTDEEINILLEGLDEESIESVLKIYNDLNILNKVIKNKLEVLGNRLESLLKARKWDSFKDEKTKISVTLSTQQKESVNKKALEMLLNEEQYSQVITKKAQGKITVINEQDRERLKKHGKK